MINRYLRRVVPTVAAFAIAAGIGFGATGTPAQAESNARVAVATSTVAGVDARVTAAGRGFAMHPQLCSASNPCDVKQSVTKTYGVFTLRSCFYSNGTSDIERITVNNTFSGQSQMRFHIQEIRADTGAVIDGTGGVYIPFGGVYTFWVDGSDIHGNWTAQANSRKVGARIRMTWSDNTTAADWFLSPHEQGHTASGDFYESTTDTIWPEPPGGGISC